MFALNIPFIAIAVVMVWKLVPRSRNADEAPIDVRGALLSIIGVSTLVYAIIEAPGHGWLAAETLGVAAIGVIALAAFVWWELRAENPMLNGAVIRLDGAIRMGPR